MLIPTWAKRNTGVLGDILAVGGVKNAVLRAYALGIMVAVLLAQHLLSVLGAEVRHFEGVVPIVSSSLDGFREVEIEEEEEKLLELYARM